MFERSVGTWEIYISYFTFAYLISGMLISLSFVSVLWLVIWIRQFLIGLSVGVGFCGRLSVILLSGLRMRSRFLYYYSISSYMYDFRMATENVIKCEKCGKLIYQERFIINPQIL